MHLPRALVFLLRHPGLWPSAALPVVLTGALLGAGLFGAVLVVGPIVELGVGRLESLHPFLLWFALAGVGAGTLAIGLLVGLGAALVLVGPLLEGVSRQVEHTMLGETTEAETSLAFGLREAFAASSYFLVRAPAVFLLSLVPLIGPFLGVFWTAHSLAFQQTESTLTRRGLDFDERRRWHAEHRAVSLGFGLAGVAFLLIPVANLLLLPTIVVGATRLVLCHEPVSARSDGAG